MKEIQDFGGINSFDMINQCETEHYKQAFEVIKNHLTLPYNPIDKQCFKNPTLFNLYLKNQDFK